MVDTLRLEGLRDEAIFLVSPAHTPHPGYLRPDAALNSSPNLVSDRPLEPHPFLSASAFKLYSIPIAPEHRFLTPTTDQVCRRFGPGILVTVRAGIFDLVAVWLDSCDCAQSAEPEPGRRLPLQLKTRCQQFVGCYIKAATRHDLVANSLPGHLAGLIQ